MISANNTAGKDNPRGAGQAGRSAEGPNLRFVSQDHLTGTSVTTNQNGDTVVGKMTYFPYGATRTTYQTIGTEMKFTRQRLDSGVDLYYYGARYHDANIGRFISADSLVSSLRNPQSLNRYSYVTNNPIRYTDPTGHCIPLCLVVAALAVAPLVPNAPRLSDVVKATIATAVTFGAAIAARSLAERGGSYGPRDFSPDVPEGIADLQIKASTPPTEFNVWPSGPPPEFDPVAKAIVATAIITVVVTSVAGTLSEALEKDGAAPREPGHDEPSMPVETPGSQPGAGGVSQSSAGGNDTYGSSTYAGAGVYESDGVMVIIGDDGGVTELYDNGLGYYE